MPLRRKPPSPKPAIPPKPFEATYSDIESSSGTTNTNSGGKTTPPPPPLPPLPPDFRPELEDGDNDYDNEEFYVPQSAQYRGVYTSGGVESGWSGREEISTTSEVVAPTPVKLSTTELSNSFTNDTNDYYNNTNMHYNRSPAPQIRTPPQPQFFRQQSPGINPNPGFSLPPQLPNHPFPSPTISQSPNLKTRTPPARFSPRLTQQQQQQQQQQQYQGYFEPGVATSSPGGGSAAITTSMAGLSFNGNANANGLPAHPAQRRPSGTFSPVPVGNQSPPRLPASLSNPTGGSANPNTNGNGTGPPALTAALPTVQTLTAALPTIQSASHPAQDKVAWAHDVLSLVGKAQHVAYGSAGAGTDPVVGPARFTDEGLYRLADAAVGVVVMVTGGWGERSSNVGAGVGGGTDGGQGQKVKPPLYVAEAFYLLGVLNSTGVFPHHVPQNPRTAFREFEQAARAGYHAAWYKLGRDYESFGDERHAVECFERGVRRGVESCLYRMGMAHLMGQLNLPANVATAVPLLHRAAQLSSVACPQPAYVFALLLLNEFQHVNIPHSLIIPLLPPSTSIPNEAKKYLERSAYLGFSPAQYKLGHAYEYAQPPELFPFSPLLSVQYYALASQNGEVEADMALSKWFLCGSEGVFDKDEGLAWTFAEKAARRGLESAQFALGYYLEVGIGGRRDVGEAKVWYQKAADQGNTDAQQRLQALSHPEPQTLSRSEHNTLTENKLVRKRTQAKQRSDAEGGRGRVNPFPAPAGSNNNTEQVVELVRRTSRMDHARRGSQPQPQPQRSRTPQQQSQQQLPPQQQPLPQQQPPSQQQQPLSQQQQPIQPLSAVPMNVRPPSHTATLPANPAGPPPVHHQPPRHGYSLSDNPVPRPQPGDELNPPTLRERPPRGPSRYASPGRRVNSNSTSNAVFDSPSTVGTASPHLPTPSPPAREREGEGDAPRPATKYETFADMGFKSQKLDDDKCVIM